MQDVLGIGDGSVVRASTTMTGGIGGQGNACGSLLGSAMMLGLVYGRDRDSLQDMGKMGNSIGQAARLYEWFEQKFGSPACRDIVTAFGNGVYYDMGVPEQIELAMKAGVLDKCNNLVEETVAYMVDRLYDDVKKE